MDSSAGTETDAEAWMRRGSTPWGRLQSSLLRRRLVSWLGTDSLGSVLDVGCGLGDMTAELAAKADKVTCVDRVLNDLLPNELKTDANLAVIEELELELGERRELVDVAAIVHVLGRRG